MGKFGKSVAGILGIAAIATTAIGGYVYADAKYDINSKLQAKLNITNPTTENLNKTKEELSASLAIAKAKEDKLQQDLVAVNGKLKAAITEKDSLLSQTITLESELAIKIAEVQRLSTEQNTTQGELMEKTQILTTLQSEKEVLQSSLNQKTTDIAALTTQKTNLETQLTTLQSENAKLQEDLKFCRSKNTAMSLYGKSFLPKFDYFSRDVNSVIARVPGVVEISNFATDPGGVTHHYSFNIENGVLSLNRESIPGGTYSYEYLPHSDWCNILIGGKVAYSCNGHSLKEILPNGTEIIRTAQEVFCEVHGLTFDRRVR